MTDEEMRRNFKLNLMSYLATNNITQHEFACRSGISVSVINRYLHGMGMPTVYNLWRIASCTGTTMDDLVQKNRR